MKYGHDDTKMIHHEIHRFIITFPGTCPFSMAIVKWGNSHGQLRSSPVMPVARQWLASGSPVARQFTQWENKQVATNLEEDQEAPEYHAFEASCAAPGACQGLLGTCQGPSHPSQGPMKMNFRHIYVCNVWMYVFTACLFNYIYIYICMYV